MKVARFLLIGILLCNTTWAQETYLSLGIKGGISVPGIQNNSKNPVLNGYTTQIAPYGGIEIHIPFNKNFAIVSGLEYIPITAKKDGNQIIPKSVYEGIFPPGFSTPAYLYSNFKSNFQVNYIQMPVNVAYTFNSETNASFYVQGGFFMGVAISGKIISEGIAPVYYDEARTRLVFPAQLNLNQQINALSYVREVNIGFQGVAGIKYNHGFGASFLQIAANSGIIPMQKIEADGNNKSAAVLASIGFIFHLKQ